MKRMMLANVSIIASTIASPYPQVTEKHFAPISKYASPIEAFLINKIYKKDSLVESKLLAGLREKAQDHHTRSSLYKENRKILSERGLKDAVKSLPEENDFLKAQSLAHGLLSNFYKSKFQTDPASVIFGHENDVEESVPAYSQKVRSEFQFHMEINPIAFNLEKHLGSLEKDQPPYTYLGSLPMKHSISLLYNGYGLYPISDNGKTYVLAFDISNEERAICPLLNRIYDCNDFSTPLRTPPPLMAIFSKGPVPEALWTNWPNQQKIDNELKDIIEDPLEDLRHMGHAVNYDTPLIASHSPGAFPTLDPSYPELNSIIVKDSMYFPTNVKNVLYKETNKGQDSAEFKFTPELKLRPGQSVYLAVPKSLQAKTLANVILAHRQNPNDQRGRMDFDPRTGAKTYDKWPAYTSVQVHDINLPYRNSWRIWAGPVSSDKGSKFAEIRNSPEKDNLYEWPLKGSLSLRTGSHQNRNLNIDLVKLEALGSDPTYIESVVIKTLPPLASAYMDISYTRNKTYLGDPQTQKGRVYGGGQRYNGVYPGAKKIYPHDRGGKDFEIPIQGKAVRSVSLALGDTHPDGRRNRDGGTGTPGGSKISIALVDTSGNTTVILDEENLGPQGVVTASSELSVPIEKISIRAYDDTAYLMGAQIGLEDLKTKNFDGSGKSPDSP